MSAVPDISLILPAYNEVRTIAGTLRETVEYMERRGRRYEIIVAADGDDGTRETARELAKCNPAILVIGDKGRRGKGRGIREGVAVSRGAIVGFADADNKVPISELDRIEPFLKDYDLVIGSRAMAASQVERRQPFYREIGGKGFGIFMRLVTGLPIGDTQCGFKFFRRDVALDLFSRQRIDRYMFDVEVLSLAWRLGYRIREVPIRWRDDADSRLQLLLGNLHNVIDVLKIAAWHRVLHRPRRAAP